MIKLFNIISKKELTVEDGYLLLVCNKLARQSYKKMVFII